jgi:hypothetical protein
VGTDDDFWKANLDCDTLGDVSLALRRWQLLSCCFSYSFSYPFPLSSSVPSRLLLSLSAHNLNSSKSIQISHASLLLDHITQFKFFCGKRTTEQVGISEGYAIDKRRNACFCTTDTQECKHTDAIGPIKPDRCTAKDTPTQRKLKSQTMTEFAKVCASQIGWSSLIAATCGRASTRPTCCSR